MSELRGFNPGQGWRNLLATLAGALHVFSPVSYSQQIQVPGIGTGSAYAADDAFGTAFELLVPNEGTISHVYFLDFDDEGIQKDVVFFRKSFTGTADNSAFAVSDADLRNCIGVAKIITFVNFANNQVGYATPSLSYVLPTGRLYCQIVTRGADNIAAGVIPEIFVVVV